MTIPSNLIPTRVTELPQYGGTSTDGTIMYTLGGRTYQVQLSQLLSTGSVPGTRQVIAGAGLTGGGALSSDVTVSVSYSGTSPAALGLASAGVSTSPARSDHVHPAVDLSDTAQTSNSLPLSRGGTGSALSPAAGALAYSTGSALALTAVGTSGQVLTSNGTGAPSWSTITGTGTVTSVAASGGTTGLSFSGGPITGAGTLTLAGTLAVANGGTGQTTYTNGQLLIGNTTGGTLAKATLTAGTGIAVTNGAGSITLAIADGARGDITVSASGATWTVGNGAVTYAKLQNVSATDRLLGRSTAGAGIVEEITCTAAGRALLDDVDAAAQRATLGLVIGTNVQAWDADLDTWATKAAPAGAVVGTTDTQTLSGKTLVDPAITGTITEDVYQITDGAAFEVDPGNGSIQYVTLGASRTPKATNFANGEMILLMVDDGTAYTVTWSDATWGGTGVVWKTDNGVAPTLNTTGYTGIVLWKVAGQVYGARVGDA